MYGMVNEAVKGLVLSAFGKDAWEKIHTQANSPESFVSLDSYDDAVTYNLVEPHRRFSSWMRGRSLSNSVNIGLLRSRPSTTRN